MKFLVTTYYRTIDPCRDIVDGKDIEEAMKNILLDYVLNDTIKIIVEPLEVII